MGRAHWLGLAAVLILASTLRFYRLDYGLPELVFVDAFRLVRDAFRVAFFDSPEPFDVIYPGAFKLLLAGVYRVFGVVTNYWVHQSARLLAATFGLGVMLATYLIARRLGARSGAVVAAGLYGFCVVAVDASRIASTNTLLDLSMTLVLLTLVERESLDGADVLDTERAPLPLKRLWAAGALCGLAMGTKYTGVYAFFAIGLVALAAAIRQGAYGRWFLRLSSAGLLAVAVFIATTPWLVTFPERYWRGFVYIYNVQKFGQIGRVQGSYADYMWSSGVTVEQPFVHLSILHNMGPLVLALAFVAVGLALAGRLGRQARWLGFYVTVFVLAVSGPGKVAAARYLLPILPPLFVLCGLALERLVRVERLRRVASVLAVAVLALPLLQSAKLTVAASAPITSQLAKEWARKKIPPGTTVFLSPFFTDNLRQLPIQPLGLAAGGRQYNLPPEVGPNPERDPIYDGRTVARFRGMGARYFVLNSHFEGALYNTENNRRWFPKSVAAYADFRRSLEDKAELVFSIDGANNNLLGPDIRIYRIP